MMRKEEVEKELARMELGCRGGVYDNVQGRARIDALKDVLGIRPRG